MSLHLLVPAKTELPKLRLSATLDEPARAAIMRALLEHTLCTIRSAGDHPLAVVTAQADARAIASRFGAQVVHDGGGGPNAAVGAAVQTLVARGASLVLVLAADLPLLDAHTVRRLVDSVRPNALTLAPDRLGFGTNALACPGAGFPYAFGPNSFRLHASAAAARGWPLHVVRSPGLGADLDEPSDLDLLRHVPGWAALEPRDAIGPRG